VSLDREGPAARSLAAPTVRQAWSTIVVPRWMNIDPPLKLLNCIRILCAPGATALNVKFIAWLTA
jgi:hypothetical protein